MDKRYQVFVSSTYEDLREERQEVIQALLELDCIPTGMELFPASDEESWTLIQRFISECDYYIVIVAGRYGSVDQRVGKSYTQMEYEYAVESGIPALAFLHEDPGKIIASKSEKTNAGKRALAEFKKIIESRRHWKSWSNAKDLGGAVSRGIANLIKTKPRVGWVRADCVPDHGAAEEILRLRRRLEHLEAELSDARSKPPQGAEELAQGDEVIPVTFSCSRPGESGGKEQCPYTWNELLILLGPSLLAGCTEAAMKGRLQSAMMHRMRDNGAKVSVAVVWDEDFQRVKLQFRALGLITELDDVGNGSSGWMLTQYGDHVLTQIAAIKSARKMRAAAKKLLCSRRCQEAGEVCHPADC